MAIFSDDDIDLVCRHPNNSDVSISFSSSIPANAQSFWHQIKDQALNRHGGQYSYGGHSGYGSQYGYGRGNYGQYYGNGYNSGIYGNQQLQQHQLLEHQQLERQQQYGY